VSTWIRLDIDLDAHPDIIAAGDYALDTFVAVLRMCKQYGEAGHVEGKYTTPRYLARRMLWPPSRAKDITRALMGLLDVGLITKTDDGFEVPGWRRFQQDRTGAERSRRYRERKRNVSQRDATPVTAYQTGQDQTEPNITERDLDQSPTGDGLTDAETGQGEQEDNGHEAKVGRVAYLFRMAGCSPDDIDHSRLGALVVGHADLDALCSVLSGLAARGIAKGKRKPFKYTLKALDTALAERAATVAKATAGTLEGKAVEVAGQTVKVPRGELASIKGRSLGGHGGRGGSMFDRLVVAYALESGQIDGVTAERLRHALTSL